MHRISPSEYLTSVNRYGMLDTDETTLSRPISCAGREQYIAAIFDLFDDIQCYAVAKHLNSERLVIAHVQLYVRHSGRVFVIQKPLKCLDTISCLLWSFPNSFIFICCSH